MWTEEQIAGALARQLFNSRTLVVVNNCNWTGCEADLLCVMPCMRVVDVEIKLTRADLRADREKYKWWRELGGQRIPRRWPPAVWKHYVCMPASVWRDDWLADLQPISGLLLVRHRDRESQRDFGQPWIDCRRRAKPCADAKPIEAQAAIDIARLASLRMWDAYARLDKWRADRKQIEEMAA